jgi:hypothetical protein
MKTVSWVLLALVGTLMLLGGLASASVAYRSAQERIAGVELHELAAGREEVVTALRARRGTAAAYAAGFATLFLFVVLGPYRRGEIWSWWAVLVATLVLALLSAARIPFLGTAQGAAPTGIALGVVIVALMLDVGRLMSSSHAR